MATGFFDGISRVLLTDQLTWRIFRLSYVYQIESLTDTQLHFILD